YQKEERSLIAGRLRVEGGRIKDLMNVMIKDRISLPQHTEQLKQELAKHYRNSSFLNCVSMGDIVQKSLDLVTIH
ncbi:MAG: hypothetical protein EAZ14_08070, partial [Runella slithyformis]